MTIKEAIKARKIKEVLHFTTHKGLLGVLHSGCVLSRARLPKETRLEHIYEPNASYRKDQAWLDYVNLSISSINHRFFDSSCRWHREIELWWCILVFDPIILTHENVVFATTNNMYTGVQRSTGLKGFLSLFEPTIELWTGNQLARPSMIPLNFTTCPQAEALYPHALTIEHLKSVYVICDSDADEVHAQLCLTNNSDVTVIVDASRFKSERGNYS